MGFHLRKSYNLGGMRLNLSNSGVGFSSGVKGLRVGIDGKGRSYIGGGKGMLRYRKYASTSDFDGEENITVEEESHYIMNADNIPKDLKYTSPKLRIFLLIFWGFVSALFLIECPFAWLVAIGILIYKYCFSSKIKIQELVHNALNLYNNGDLNGAVEVLKNVRTLLAKEEYLKNYIDDTVLHWFLSSDNYQEALNYIEDIPLNNKQNQLITIYYGLEQWESLINLLQQNYSQEELNSAPELLTTLAEAFLKLNQNDVALNVLMQSGLNNKRKMDDGMCMYRYTLGKCYEILGDKKKAVKQFEKIYAYNTNYEDVKTKLEKINNLSKGI